MNYNPRVIEIPNASQGRAQLLKIGCDPAGINIMTPKTVFKTVLLENVPAKAANLLKQTFLAKGGEAAITRGSADLSVDYTNVLICATLKQYRLALAQLKLQPWGLPKLAVSIELVLEASETFPKRDYTFKNCSLTISPDRTLVMGILNITPDSFSDGGKYNTLDNAIRHAEEMIENGADIIDIGAESTRPYGSRPVSADEEAERLLPVLEKVLALSPIPVSVDTYKASVAEAALKAGAHIINDVWGLQHDPDMAGVVARHQVPVIIMHNRLGTDYEQDIMSHICKFLQTSIDIGVRAGVNRELFIVDPGIGFGKTPAQNLVVMSRLDELKSLGCPILLGTSRKRFIGEVLNLPVEERVEGTGATVALGITKGVSIVRVHDVKEITRIVRMLDAMKRRQESEG